MDIPFGALFTRGDLELQSFVKELVEENEFRIPMDDERWLLITEALPEIVAAHAKVIETDCVKKINEANDKALEESQSAGRCLYVNNNDKDLRQNDNLGGDGDCIPICLLSATSFFKHAHYGQDAERYAEVLHRRSLAPLQSWSGGGFAWSTVNFLPSGPFVFTASCLLEHLRLPKNTTMAYMLACGADFQCLVCTRRSGTWSMTWAKLVCRQHFLYSGAEMRLSGAALY